MSVVFAVLKELNSILKMDVSSLLTGRHDDNREARIRA